MSSNDPGRLPLDPRTGAPLPPRAQPGYYPRSKVLAQSAFWDEATRAVIQRRVEQVPALHFFSASDAALLQAVVDRLIPQDDRDDAHRIPIVPFVDERLTAGRGPGYRYEDMPADPDAYRLGLEALDEMARTRWQRPFVALEGGEQDALLQSLSDGKPDPSVALWERMSPHRFFLLLLHDASAVYYAHPWAWDEIGFGGPAYPRGYMRLARGEAEPWEGEEERYAWTAPGSGGGAR